MKIRSHRAVSLVICCMTAIAFLPANAATPAVSSAEARTERYFQSIRNNPNLLLAFLRAMPKGGDLHNHLTGAIYAESLHSVGGGGGRLRRPRELEPQSRSLPATIAPGIRRSRPTQVCTGR